MSPDPEAPPGASAGGLGAIPVLLSSPVAAYERLRANPQWLGLLVFCAVAAGIAAWISLPQALEAETAIMLDAVERFDLPPEQVDQMLADQPDPDDISAWEITQRVGGATLATVVVLLVGLAVFHLITRISGPEPTFRQSGAIFFLAAVASAGGSLLKGVLMRVSDTIDVTLGPGALIPGLDPASLPAAFLNLFDVFSLLNLWLLMTGIVVVLGVARGTAWAISGAYWILKSIVVFSMMLFRIWISGNL
jgi:hypothetical protein